MNVRFVTMRCRAAHNWMIGAGGEEEAWSECLGDRLQNRFSPPGPECVRWCSASSNRALKDANAMAYRTSSDAGFLLKARFIR